MNITTVQQTITAEASTGLFRKVFTLAGRYIRLLETVNPVTVKLGRGRKAYETLESVEAGAWARVKAGDDDFDTIEIVCSTSEAVKFVISDGEAGYDRLFTAIAQARTMALPGNVTVGTGEAAVLAAGSRRKVVFSADAGNSGTIYLGPTGLTTTTGVIELGPGDMWIEETAASAQWRAIATASGQTLRVMTAG